MNKRRMVAGAMLALVLAVCADAAPAATRTVTIHVEGMTCGGCAVMIEEALKGTEGVREARVSYERGEAWVKYDDRKVTAARLREVINAAGFKTVAKPARRARRSGKQKATSCCSPVSCNT